MKQPKIQTIVERAVIVLMFAFVVMLVGNLVRQGHVIRTLRGEIAATTEELEKAKRIIGDVFKQEVTDFTTFSTPVTITAYTAREEECDSTPETTADGTPSRIGLLAMSNDLYKELGFKKGDRVMLVTEDGNLGVFAVHDGMNKRWRRRVDILHGNVKAARLFGKTPGQLVWLKGERV
jgi:3D (Asp-Asp-Asp) domain-containing protein